MTNRLSWWLKAIILGAVLTTTGLAFGSNDLRWGLTGDATSLDPQGRLGAVEFIFFRASYEGLMVLDKNNSPIPGLAKSHEILADGTYRFHLRRGVKFHGGEDFNADDAIFSLNRCNAPTSGFRGFTSAIGTITKIDDYTIDIKNKRPDPLFLNNLAAVFIMDSGWAAKHGVEKAPDAKNPKKYYTDNHMNGTGSFMMTSRKTDVKTTFKRNRDWWGNGLSHFPGNLDTLTVTPISNAATRVATLLSGDLDLVTELPLPDIARVDNDANLKTDSTSQFRTMFFGYNLGTDDAKTANVDGNPFLDVRVRQAITKAIDTRLIQKKIMRGVSIPTSIMAYPGTHGYTDSLAAPVSVDRAGAKALLAQAGYPNGFSIRMDCPNNRYINDEAICQAATSMLAKVGIKVTLNALPKDQWMPMVMGNKSDFYLLGFGTPTMDSLFTFGHIFKSGPFHTGYNNPKVTELINAAGVEMNKAKRRSIMEEITRITKEDAAVSILHYQKVTWGMKNNITM
ncbi:MAG: ABC transporter substrate-binding protein, partial [Proteobacteria bacterium]|nr:ABC transporter substrate-binding protein [Pseudomonadota bacterium]